MTKAAFIKDVRRLMRHCRSGSLATTYRGKDPAPYVALTALAPDTDGLPIFLFSDLSVHTQNIKHDPRAAVLFEKASRHLNPQRGPRVTLMGRVEKTEEARHRRRYLARHPEAAMYEVFTDFAYYSFKLEKVHYVGGFGKAVWVTADDIRIPEAAVAAIAEAEERILEHLNADHGDALDDYAVGMLGKRGTGWRAIGVDPLGLDMMRENRLARLDFPELAPDADGVRKTLVALAEEAGEKGRARG